MQHKAIKPSTTSASTACVSALKPDSPVTRRSFLGKATAATVLAGCSSGVVAGAQKRPTGQQDTFLDLLRVPDALTAFFRLGEPLQLQRSGTEWHGYGVSVENRTGQDTLTIAVTAPGVELKFLHLRWRMPVARNLIALGDHWERSYGDLAWRNLISERVMPWYFATHDGSACHAYGVKTGAGALCFWQLDPEGVSLWLNTANGGSGVRLGQRTLVAAAIVTCRGSAGEDPTSALHKFCRQMCSQPSLPVEPVYGTNDWYYAYGKNTAEQILKDTDFIAELSASNAVRPFSVVDMGWVEGSNAFGSMARLAEDIRDRKVRPGIWIRPLEAAAGTDAALLLPAARFGTNKERAMELAYDPTIPEALETVLAQVRQAAEWGYDMVKHDFSTYDLLGQWGFEMGAEPTHSGWSLHDRGLTNAEVILNLYKGIRQACGRQTLILGCNTVGHLAQGWFDIQRTGDDTSGRVWERTRRMGVNTLAFRLPQHGSFFVLDADCVGITGAVPWELNAQWLNLLARTGTALFISPGEGARNPERARVIRDAFRLSTTGGDGARPVNWRQESTPEEWAAPANGSNDGRGGSHRYDWCSPGGAYPFSI